jgi:hypothetical protein
MDLIWTAEGDWLLVRDQAGRLRGAWPGDEKIGRTLAHLLNGAPGLSQLLVLPL